MPTFRQRPLTWLFVIATVCVDIAVAASSWPPQDSREALVVWGLLGGQLYVLGGWLALGESHRLLRAGVYVAAVLALATLNSMWVNAEGILVNETWNASTGRWEMELGTFKDGSVDIEIWGIVLAIVVLYSAIPALAAGATFFLGGAIRRRWALPAPVRFPVVELLGWMIVVAVASAALRFSDFTALDAPVAEWIVMGGSLAMAGLIYAILDRREGTTLLVNLAVSAVLVVALVVGASALTPDNDSHVVVALAYVYLAAWIGAGWLDKHAVGMPLQRESGPRAGDDGPDVVNAAELHVAAGPPAP